MTRSSLNRPLYYGTGMDDTVHAYNREEWGIGGSQPFGNYAAHTFTGLVVATALMTVPAIVSPVLFLFALVRLNLTAAILSLVFSVLFAGGWLLTVSNLRKELKASKLRNLKGLPKPRFAVTDDQARWWFEKNPGVVSITPENFPDSTLPFPTEDVPE